MFKKLLLILSIISLSYAESEERAQSQEPIQESQIAMNEKTEEHDIATISRAFGHHVGRTLASPEFVNLDLDAVIKGIKEESEGKESPLNEADYTRAVTKIQEKRFMHNAEQNLEKAIAFLAENKEHENIVAIEDGKLQYSVDKQGKGEQVVTHSTPLIHYTGKYLDGKEFSTSRGGEPIALSLDEAISGFAKGIVGMKEGEKRTLYIHPELGYGTTGFLHPNSLLIFEVEVIKVDTPIEKETYQDKFDENEHHKMSLN